MNIFYWKGQTASVPSATSGTTYTTWVAATNVGLTANWVMAFSNLTSLIVGATRLPGPLDYVYIQDKYPNIGSTYSGISFSNYSITQSPCAGASTAFLSGDVVYIGPFENYVFGEIPPSKITTVGITYGSARVGGNIQGNSSIVEFSGFTGCSLSGVPLGISANVINIIDSDKGGYDVNIYSKSAITEIKILPPASTADPLTLSSAPWKNKTSVRLGSTFGFSCTAKNINVASGVVLGELTMHPDTVMTHDGGATASHVMTVEGQIFKMDIKPSTATMINHIRIAPKIRCFDVGTNGTYYFGSDVYRGSGYYYVGGESAELQSFGDLGADLLLESPVRWGTFGTPQLYNVVLGTHSLENNTASKYKFLSKGNQWTGPKIFLRGHVILQDFDLGSGSMLVDGTNQIGHFSLTCGNGVIRSALGANFSQYIQIATSQILSGMEVQGSPSSDKYGIRVAPAAMFNTKFPIDRKIETHVSSPYLANSLPPTMGVSGIPTNTAPQTVACDPLPCPSSVPEAITTPNCGIQLYCVLNWDGSTERNEHPLMCTCPFLSDGENTSLAGRNAAARRCIQDGWFWPKRQLGEGVNHEGIFDDICAACARCKTKVLIQEWKDQIIKWREWVKSTWDREIPCVDDRGNNYRFPGPCSPDFILPNMNHPEWTTPGWPDPDYVEETSPPKGWGMPSEIGGVGGLYHNNCFGDQPFQLGRNGNDNRPYYRARTGGPNDGKPGAVDDSNNDLCSFIPCTKDCTNMLRYGWQVDDSVMWPGSLPNFLAQYWNWERGHPQSLDNEGNPMNPTSNPDGTEESGNSYPYGDPTNPEYKPYGYHDLAKAKEWTFINSLRRKVRLACGHGCMDQGLCIDWEKGLFYNITESSDYGGIPIVNTSDEEGDPSQDPTSQYRYPPIPLSPPYCNWGKIFPLYPTGYIWGKEKHPPIDSCKQTTNTDVSAIPYNTQFD